MTQLGQGHFAVPLEALPGETVLWEGGASRRGASIRVARVAALPISLLLLYALLFVPVFLAIPPGNKKAPRCTEQSALSDSNDTTEPSSSQEPPDRKERIAARRFVAAASAVVCLLTIIVGLFGLAALQTRNAWYIVTNERICIQSGALTKSLSVIDLDKVLSVEVSNSLLERRFGLQSIQFIHAGGKNAARSGLAWATGDNYAMTFIPLDARLLSDLLNHWLPRDNGARA